MIFWGLFLATLSVVLDQLSKFWAQALLLNPSQSFDLFSFLTLTPAWNKGISFGLFHDSGTWSFYALTLIAVALILLLTYWLFQRKGQLFSVAIGLILGGALGNLLDRLIHGAVFDFIDVHYKGYHFWTFNIADLAISIGAFLFGIDILRDYLGRKKDSDQ